MSDDKPIPPIPQGVFSEEQLAKIGGGAGECTLDDYVTLLSQLRESYDTLVDFTSYVIERVAGP